MNFGVLTESWVGDSKGNEVVRASSWEKLNSFSWVCTNPVSMSFASCMKTMIKCKGIFHMKLIFLSDYLHLPLRRIPLPPIWNWRLQISANFIWNCFSSELLTSPSSSSDDSSSQASWEGNWSGTTSPGDTSSSYSGFKSKVTLAPPIPALVRSS